MREELKRFRTPSASDRKAGAFLVVLLTSLVAVSSALAAAPTKVEQWIAVRNGKIAPGIHVLVRVTGSCSNGSRLDARSDAWHCRSGSDLYDPCFEAGAVVLCPDGTPDSRDAVQIRLTSPLPRGKANKARDLTATAPWVIVTGSADYCYQLGLINQSSYQCAGGPTLDLDGVPNRTGSVWRIGISGPDLHGAHTVAIKTAWW